MYGIPGSLDGPPTPPKQSLAEKLGDVVGYAIAGSLGVLLLAAVWWAIVWLVTNMPA